MRTDMKTINTSNLTGAALDWAVAKCEGRDYTRLDGSGWTTDCFNPSTDWAQGGPIIEREGIDLYCNVPTNMAHEDPSWRGSWRAKYCRCGFGTEMSYGPTPLIAAMRCYVASKLGEEVEVPDELI